MKIYFNSLLRPKRAAKALVGLVPNLKLAKSQEAVAYLCGYDSWDELRHTTDSPDTVASPDDEDLSAEERDARFTFQCERAALFFKNTQAQSEALVRAIAPSARARSRIAAEPVVGTNVYMPPLNQWFAPNYPLVYALLPDVAELTIDFVQPTREAPSLTHLTEQLHVSFRSGQRLTLEGIYLWKFRDLAPPPFADERKNWVSGQPFSSESPQDLYWRLRLAHDHLFAPATGNQLVGDPPWQIRLNLIHGNVETTRAPGLLPATQADLMPYIKAQALSLAPSLQPVLDTLMTRYLSTGYMKLELREVARGLFGNAYVPQAWSGCESWTFSQFLTTYSPEERHASGCGGNLLFRELLERDLLEQIQPQRLLTVWLGQLKKEDPALFQRLAFDLELPRRVAAGRLTETLLAAKDGHLLTWAITRPVLAAQSDKPIGAWIPELSAKKATPLRNRPVGYGKPPAQKDSSHA